MNELEYQEFLKTKRFVSQQYGIPLDVSQIHPALFEFQRDIVSWQVKQGRGAIFADVGLGKTIMYCEWARQINLNTLMVVPLAVAMQTVEMAQNLLGMEIRYVRSQTEVTSDAKFYITNYEMIEHFDAGYFSAVILDESSILKSITSKTRQIMTEMFKDTEYRLCCTATPAPNDLIELGNHAEFLGIISAQEMQSIFFTYDSGAVDNHWKLKGHAKEQFYQWLASWAVALKRPSDLGYSDDGYILPELHVKLLTVDGDYTPEGMLPGFFVGSISATDAKKVRRQTIGSRLEVARKMMVESDEQWIVWAGLNDEAIALHEAIPGSINVEGSMSMDAKVSGIQSFVKGETRVLITKASIAGMGVNMQNCRNMLFFGIDYSWESFYQAIGRIHRFGQKADAVNVFVLTSEEERSIYGVIERKGKEAQGMTQELINASAEYVKGNLKAEQSYTYTYRTDETQGENWRLLLGDSCERMSEIADGSVHLSVYSPPFSDLFVYSPTERDLGNSRNLDDFFKHYSYIIRENLRVTMPGRLTCVHITDTRFMKGADGYRGRKDFSGMVIEAYQNEGWIFWQRITIDKNPQAQAIRMKDHGLLFKTLKKDSTDLSGGHPDYILVFKKHGDNPIPVTPFAAGEVSSEDWIKWAHPVWNDIRETNTLNVAVARTDQDEKHMCPLQLDVIDRLVRLWTNPGETVFSPFAGIGSEGVGAIRKGRKFVGIELKPEYYNVALRNLDNAVHESYQGTLWSLGEQQSPEENIEVDIETV